MLGTIEGNGAIDISFFAQNGLAAVLRHQYRLRRQSAPSRSVPTPSSCPRNSRTIAATPSVVALRWLARTSSFFLLARNLYRFGHYDVRDACAVHQHRPTHRLEFSPWSGLGLLTPFVGVTYFRTHAKITGHFDVPIQDAGGQTARLNYEINQSVVGAWRDRQA
jgi:hypothetical protein